MSLFGPPDTRDMARKGNLKGLLKALQHKDARVRLGAADALDRFKQPEVVDALINALGDANKLVRATAACSLGTLGDRRALAHVQAAFPPGSQVEFPSLPVVLGQLGDASAMDELIARLQKSPHVVYIDALEKLKQPAAVPALLEMAAREIAIVSARAMAAARKLSPQGLLAEPMFSTWAMDRTNVFCLHAHNVTGRVESGGVTRLTQTWTHAGPAQGCPACTNLMKEYIKKFLPRSQFDMPIGFEPGDGQRYTYS